MRDAEGFCVRVAVNASYVGSSACACALVSLQFEVRSGTYQSENT